MLPVHADLGEDAQLRSMGVVAGDVGEEAGEIAARHLRRHLEQVRVLVARVALDGLDVFVGEDAYEGRRRLLAIFVTHGVIVDGDGEAGDVDVEVVDGRLVEVIDAEDDVAMPVLPRTEIAQMLVAGDPGPSRCAPEAGTIDVNLALQHGGEVKVAPAASYKVLPEHVRHAPIVKVRVRRLHLELLPQHFGRLPAIVSQSLVHDPRAALLSLRRRSGHGLATERQASRGPTGRRRRSGQRCWRPTGRRRRSG